MKKLTEAFKNALEQDVLTMATCWVLSKKDGTKIGFTDHIEDIVENEFIYYACSGFESSSIETSTSINPNNFEISGVFSTQTLDKLDLQLGVYEHSYIEVFIMDYLNPTYGKVMIKSGYIGEIRISDNKFSIEINTLAHKLNSNLMEVYSPDCRAEFCDSKCKIESVSTIKGKITDFENNTRIIDKEINIIDRLYNFGKLMFISGQNSGETRNILEARGDTISINLAFNKQLEIGDEFIIQVGCDKKIETCAKIYNNALNFRGEPHLIQMEEIYDFQS